MLHKAAAEAWHGMLHEAAVHSRAAPRISLVQKLKGHCGNTANQNDARCQRERGELAMGVALGLGRLCWDGRIKGCSCGEDGMHLSPEGGRGGGEWEDVRRAQRGSFQKAARSEPNTTRRMLLTAPTIFVLHCLCHRRSTFATFRSRWRHQQALSGASDH